MNFHSRGDRRLRVAVVVPGAAAGAVLAGLGHVAAQLLDHQADPVGGDPGHSLPGLGVGGAVVIGTQQRVDELCRPLRYAGQPVPVREEARGWSWRRKSAPAFTLVARTR